VFEARYIQQIFDQLAHPFGHFVEHDQMIVQIFRSPPEQIEPRLEVGDGACAVRVRAIGDQIGAPATGGLFSRLMSRTTLTERSGRVLRSPISAIVRPPSKSLPSLRRMGISPRQTRLVCHGLPE